MQDKTKNIIVVISFLVILLAIFLANIITKDEKVSISERRKLAQFPKITVKEIFSGKISDNFEKYSTDQFVQRDLFRGIKYFFSTNIFRQKDNNKLFIENDEIYKMEYPLNTASVEQSSKKLKDIYLKYLQGMNVYYSVIPDKAYYLPDDHLKMDYGKIQEIMQKNLEDIKYIDILPYLNKNDYYKTDIHWKQENLEKIASKIKEEMNIKNTNKSKLNKKELGDFYGAYYGQVGITVEPDKLIYLTNDIIENCTTYNYETKKQGNVYDLEKYKTSADKYDIFLSGATPLIKVKNPNSTTDKELLLFRDSFGSSIAPLLLDSYKKITLIDIRYMSSDLLGEYIDFKDQDVLFLYSSTVLNQNILR